jgi:hypothetical protein
VGDEGLFKGGCPVCGYAAVPGHGDIKTRSRKEMEGLPLWMYVLAGSLLLVVLAFLFFTLD